MSDWVLNGLIVSFALAIAAVMTVEGCRGAATPCNTYTIDAGYAPTNPGF